MNANELADELERLYQQDIIDGVADLSMPEAATMLRQQQAEIEALKRPNNVVGVPQDKLADMQATIRQQQAEIEALKHQVTGLKLSWQCETDIVEKQQTLIKEQDKKIIELAFRAVYAERSNEVVKELSK